MNTEFQIRHPDLLIVNKALLRQKRIARWCV